MQKLIHVLIIENESLIVDSLQSALNRVSELHVELTFKVTIAKKMDLVLHEIDKAITGIPFDFALLNADISETETSNPLDTFDIGVKLKTYFPALRLIVLTSNCHNYKVNNILSSINPDGFLIKNDIDFNELVHAISRVLIAPPYYSRKVLSLIRNRISNNISIDKIDLSILYYLSKGVRTKNLTQHVCLSISGIERRKRGLREVFDVDKGDDVLLLKRAKKAGLI